ncbi:MAG TPA: hypothetical protein VE088_06890 [Gaiellaceae bacterium]|jgi:hypothetical protein|nr:hypothetical protein [Gaiellaceae bacterium]
MDTRVTTSGGEGNLLLLLVGDVAPHELRARLSRLDVPARRVHVVAPALVGALDWLATAEDAAHLRAEVRALEAEWTLADRADVEGGAGEADPVQAVEDALRSFAADAIVIAGGAADGDLDAAVARFGLPVLRLQDPPRRRSRGYRGARALAGGRWEGTPFVLFVGVNGVLLLLGVLLSLLVLLVLWLAGAL